MSKEVLEQVILKASSDARFRAQLNDNFESAIRPYSLSPEEKAKVRAGTAAATGDDREARRTMAASVAQSAVAGSATAQTAEAQSAHAQTAEAQTAAAQTAEAQTAEAQTAEAQTAEAQTVEGSSQLTS
ncbi:MAG: hypothetical protein M3Z11_13050 [Candidatus Dormibacteraeota bacterium]|nr:hypothetical protein [Candidatus Dormibacteraeota bacterium]